MRRIDLNRFLTDRSGMCEIKNAKIVFHMEK